MSSRVDVKAGKKFVEFTLRGGPELKKLHEQIGNDGFTLMVCAAIFIESAQRARNPDRCTGFLLEAEFLIGLVKDLRDARATVELFACGIDDLIKKVK